MNRKLLAVLAIGLLAVAPASLHAQKASLLLAGGLSSPNGDLKEGVESGYNATVGLNFGMPLIPIGARLDAGLNGFNAKAGSSGNLRIMNVSANGIFSLGMPYMIGGLGYYSRRVEDTVAGVKVTDTQSAMGYNVGAGVKFPLGMLSPFVEARYHAMLGDKDKGADLKFFPIVFGITF